MDIHTNIPLKNYVTMKLGGNARFMADVHSVDELIEICARAQEQSLCIHVLGGGSNTIVRDEGFDGIVIRNRIMGIETLSDAEGRVTIKVGAGENWDDFVKLTVEQNLSGVEALSAIPGTVGAAPVQNVGAYGQEVAETIRSVEVLDLTDMTKQTLTNEQCSFSYRNSIFRDTELDRYVITSVTFELSRTPTQPPFYKAVQDYFDTHAITIYTAQTIRDAVMAIRAEKLPDPKITPNTGSFFKNAIIEDWQFNDLIKQYPDMPSYDMPDKMHKIPTGWLIEQTGLKGQLLHGIRIHDKNALVLINESAQSYADLAAAREEIISRVRDTFRIIITQEPLEI